VNLEPAEGREQGGQRPCLNLSDDTFNHGPAELVIVLALTSKRHNIPLRVLIEPPGGGLRVTSYIMPEMIRSVSTKRLSTYWGKVDSKTLETVEANVKILLGL